MASEGTERSNRRSIGTNDGPPDPPETPGGLSAGVGGVLWEHMSLAERLSAKHAIERTLPPTSLQDMDVVAELLNQYHVIRALQNDVLGKEEIALNQRAQLANSVAGLLSSLTKLQTSLYTSERMKRIEQVLIRHVMKLPEETAEAFLNDYAQLLGVENVVG